MRITVSSVRPIRVGGLIAEASLVLGPVEVVGAKVTDHGNGKTLVMPRSSDRRAIVRVTDKAVQAAAIAAIERAVAALEAANAEAGDGRQ